jgi:hypothetical protein
MCADRRTGVVGTMTRELKDARIGRNTVRG